MMNEFTNEYSGKTVMMPGSYDPITLGHFTQIERAARFFDRVHVVVCINPEKTYMFSVDERVALIRAATKDIRNVTVSAWDGLVVDYAKAFKIDFLLKGIRLIWPSGSPSSTSPMCLRQPSTACSRCTATCS